MTILENFQKKSLLLLVLGFMVTSCIDYDFDTPDPLEIPVGELHDIATLRQLFADNNNMPIRFTEDVSVSGIITMDGSTGNIYRTAFLQDHTAAISLRLMSPGGLFEGDSVRINLNGTTLGAHERMLQIDSVHVGNNVLKLRTKVEVEPRISTISELLTNSNLQSRLVKLEGVEFRNSELKSTWADGERRLSMNRMLRDCNGNEIIVRTSGFASFADDSIPKGNGSIVGVLAQFRDDRQIFIRRLDEVLLDNPRCPIPGENDDPISIAEIRELETGGASVIPPNRRLEGIVISDREFSNHPGQNLFLMDANGDGIALRFSSFHDFDLGDSLRVVIGSLPIERFAGLLQISPIPNGNGYVLGEGTVPQPTTTTLKNLSDNFADFESTLIYVENVVIPPSGTFAGNINVSDGTASVVMRTYDWAEFSNTPVTPGVYNMVAIASWFNGVQLQLRSLNDLEFVSEYDPGDPDDDTDLISVAELRELFTGSATTVPSDRFVEVVITSDRSAGNIVGQNAYTQDETGGIMLRFSSSHTFNTGDKVRVVVGGQTLETFRGLLQVNGIPNGNAQLIQTGQNVEPVTTTIENLKSNIGTFESTLVFIENVTITGSNTFNGETTVTDPTDNIIMFTRSSANFATNNVPAGTVNMTAIVTIFDDEPQLTIRNINDIHD